MVENKNETLRDWFHFLFGITSGCAVGYLSITLTEQLVDELKRISEQYEKKKLEHELEVQKAVNEFRKVLEDAREKEFNDSVEECISGIRKDFEAEIKKKQDDNQKVCSDSLEECLSNVREVLETSFEDRNRGILNDEKLVSDVEECLTDINFEIKYIVYNA